MGVLLLFFKLEINMYRRPTSIADAFITAAIKAGVGTSKVDHQRGTGNWIARKVALNATERGEFGTVVEQDRRPVPPKLRHLDGERRIEAGEEGYVD